MTIDVDSDNLIITITHRPMRCLISHTYALIMNVSIPYQLLVRQQHVVRVSPVHLRVLSFRNVSFVYVSQFRYRVRPPASISTLMG